MGRNHALRCFPVLTCVQLRLREPRAVRADFVQDLGAVETTSVRGDFLVELRGCSIGDDDL
jgi:hypothetical protein